MVKEKDVRDEKATIIWLNLEKLDYGKRHR